MLPNNLHEIAEYLVADSKGILAADESSGSIKKKFDKVGIPDSEENHRKYRQMLFSSPGVEQYISGVIMFDETFRQKNDQGMLFPEFLASKNILPGIKVDLGKIESPSFPQEFYTEGLDGLGQRFEEYASLGAKLAKWRAVITVGLGKPSQAVVRVNAMALARYAELAQKAGIVPIVEPEVIADGDHSIDDCEIATHTTLDIIFEELLRLEINLSEMLLKPNMVIEGIHHSEKAAPEEIAERTVNVFRKTVPKDVAGIVFLSGGQTADQATQNLCAISKIENKPWPMSFSYGRALQDDALAAWSGKDENIEQAQRVFLDRAQKNSAARQGNC